MITAAKKLWSRFEDRARRRAFARTHVGNFLAMQIFKMRTDRGLTQSQLADRIGSTQPQISEWEGSCESASLRTLYKFADEFDVALLVKFVPYSEMVREALTMAADAPVPSFGDESHLAVSYGQLKSRPETDNMSRLRPAWANGRTSNYAKEQTRPLTDDISQRMHAS